MASALALALLSLLVAAFVAPSVAQGWRPPCRPHDWMCDDGTCINRQQVCNGIPDCSNDELWCKRNTGCAAGQWRCSDGQCIDSRSRCNGRRDCANDEDPEICSYPCALGQLRCTDGKCVDKALVCDGKWDCSNDETCEMCNSIWDPDPIPLRTALDSGDVVTYEAMYELEYQGIQFRLCQNDNVLCEVLNVFGYAETGELWYSSFSSRCFANNATRCFASDMTGCVVKQIKPQGTRELPKGTWTFVAERLESVLSVGLLSENCPKTVLDIPLGSSSTLSIRPVSSRRDHKEIKHTARKRQRGTETQIPNWPNYDRETLNLGQTQGYDKTCDPMSASAYRGTFEPRWNQQG